MYREPSGARVCRILPPTNRASKQPFGRARFAVWAASSLQRKMKTNVCERRPIKGLKNSYKRTNRPIKPHIGYCYSVSMAYLLEIHPSMQCSFGC